MIFIVLGLSLVGWVSPGTKDGFIAISWALYTEVGLVCDTETRIGPFPGIAFNSLLISHITRREYVGILRESSK